MSRIETALEKAANRYLVEHELPQSGELPAEEPSGRFMPKNPAVVTLTAPDLPAAEEYRKLKTMVVKLTAQGGGLRNVIMVTSSFSGEGKSLTAINLAVSMAQEISHSALLIDADLRRPSVAEYLGIPVDVGLADCLRDGTPVASAIIPTGVPKLDILPAGRSVDNPVELLASPKMKMIISELKRQQQNRYIIIDTPPVLPFAETQVVSLLADGVLLVVKEGAATMQDMQDCLDVLKGARVLGIAFNEMSVQGTNTRYRHYYEDYAARQRRTR